MALKLLPRSDLIFLLSGSRSLLGYRHIMGGKQKVVLKVPVNDEKSRSRALRTAVGVPGCISVALEGADKNMMVVIGDGIDSVFLTKSLRKKVGGAELITVAPVEEKKPEVKANNPNNPPAAVPALQPHIIYFHPSPPYYNPEPCGCTIM